VGVANKRSIDWAIAQAWHNAGATLAFTYQGERLGFLSPLARQSSAQVSSIIEPPPAIHPRKAVRPGHTRF
jgi:enoyl-[acyl-carrier-protein] reductase (NADH)